MVTIRKAAALSIDDLRGHAIERTLSPATDLAHALERLGFVQADPIRAPARAQDLTLRHRVVDYRAGDLERCYPTLDIEEGYFINYGFMPRVLYTLLLPRAARRPWSTTTRKRAEALLAYVEARAFVHPREVDAYFAHGRVENYWGGTSSATTHLLEAMHYRGLLRVVGRERGVRLYGAQQLSSAPNDAATRRMQLDTLVDAVIRKYAPLPGPSLSGLIHRIRFRTPARVGELRSAVKRAKERLAHARLDGVDWYWPGDEQPVAGNARDDRRVRLLAPFDPLVWDRRRFELFWGWAYRFEAYTPAPKRKLGYYALPLLWRDGIVGWANLTWRAQQLECQLGFVAKRPRDPLFGRALEAELARMQTFLEASGKEDPSSE
jgi:uncharacterized protein